MFELLYLCYRLRYGKEVTSMKFKFLVILLAQEILEENITINDVPKKLQQLVIVYIKENFDIEITVDQE